MSNDSTYTTTVLCRAIAVALERPGWSQALLAKKLDVRPQTVNKWVKGENAPPLPRWGHIEVALELPPGTFMNLVMGTDAITHDVLPVPIHPRSTEERLAVLEATAAILDAKLDQVLELLRGAAKPRRASR